ncbi:6-phosphogluconate dehydrogenase C-terminal domain-like protein [Clavulina sp. PMI_390]|nr:6-phosphogluconate dehydrogenase C-terminal domain-like protein [Clavulina sp. PMI_390]
MFGPNSFLICSLGSVLGLVLQRSKRTTLSAVARSNFEAVRKDGIEIQSTSPALEGEAPQAPTPASTALSFSYVVVATKVIAETKPPLVESLEPFIVPGKTTIVLIQNGVGIEDEIQARWPDNLVLTCVAYIPAIQAAPRLVTHSGALTFLCGPFHSNGSPECSPHEKERIDTFVELCKLGGCITQTEYNHVYMQAHRWTKIAWNASWNAVTALADMDTAAYLSASTLSEPLVRRLMREVVLIARGLGIEIDPLEPDVLSPEESERIAKVLGRTGRMADMLFNRLKGGLTISSSTRSDVQAGRALEYEASDMLVIWGNPLKHAKRLGIDVPVLETVAVLIEAIDARSRGKVKVMIR